MITNKEVRKQTLLTHAEYYDSLANKQRVTGLKIDFATIARAYEQDARALDVKSRQGAQQRKE